MKKVLLTSFCLSCILFIDAKAQPITQVKCGSVIDWKSVEATPDALNTILKREEIIKKQIAALKLKSKQLGEAIYEIPVVFHIVLPDPCVVTVEAIEQQVAVLNRDFGGTNTDYGNASVFESDRAKTTNFHFSLVKQAPDGSFTNGITRTSSNLELNTFVENGQNVTNYPMIKYTISGGIDKWQDTNYTCLNIWVGKFIDGTGGSSTFPVEYNTTERPNYSPLDVEEQQGVIIDYRTIPSVSNDLPDYALGRVLVHEVGHFFNLIHIWGDDQGCSYDDFVDDTPLQEIAKAECSGLIFDACQPLGVSVKGIQYQNHMNYTYDKCRTIFTIMQAERMQNALTEYDNRKGLIASTNKALVPSSQKEQLDLKVFNSCTNPELTTTSFKTITVGKDGAVWAGTNGAGLYKYSGGDWVKWGYYPTVVYQDMKADRSGGVWIAQSGYNGGEARTGGVLYFPDSTFDGFKFYSTLNGVPSRYATSLFVDTSRYNGPTSLPLVWTANFSQLTAGVTASGGIGRGLNPVAPEFNTIRTGVDLSLNTGGVFYIGGDQNEIWTFARNNYGYSQILKHDAQTNAFIEAFDVTKGLAGLVPDQFIARGIYFDAKGNRWITVNGSGIIVQDKDGIWKKMANQTLLGVSPFFSLNGIAGDSDGNVYFGTTNGLVAYSPGNPLDDPASYKLYTTENGLPNNNVQSICVDTLRKKLLLATGDGIAFWSRVCSGVGISGKTFSTTNSGEWGTATNWCAGQVPTANDDVIVRHPITITVDTDVKSIKVISPGSITVASGVKLTIKNQ